MAYGEHPLSEDEKRREVRRLLKQQGIGGHQVRRFAEEAVRCLRATAVELLSGRKKITWSAPATLTEEQLEPIAQTLKDSALQVRQGIYQAIDAIGLGGCVRAIARIVEHSRVILCSDFWRDGKFEELPREIERALELLLRECTFQRAGPASVTCTFPNPRSYRAETQKVAGECLAGISEEVIRAELSRRGSAENIIQGLLWLRSQALTRQLPPLVTTLIAAPDPSLPPPSPTPSSRSDVPRSAALLQGAVKPTPLAQRIGSALGMEEPLGESDHQFLQHAYHLAHDLLERKEGGSFQELLSFVQSSLPVEEEDPNEALREIQRLTPDSCEVQAFNQQCVQHLERTATLLYRELRTLLPPPKEGRTPREELRRFLHLLPLVSFHLSHHITQICAREGVPLRGITDYALGLAERSITGSLLLAALTQRFPLLCKEPEEDGSLQSQKAEVLKDLLNTMTQVESTYRGALQGKSSDSALTKLGYLLQHWHEGLRSFGYLTAFAEAYRIPSQRKAKPLELPTPLPWKARSTLWRNRSGAMENRELHLFETVYTPGFTREVQCTHAYAPKCSVRVVLQRLNARPSLCRSTVIPLEEVIGPEAPQVRGAAYLARQSMVLLARVQQAAEDCMLRERYRPLQNMEIPVHLLTVEESHDDGILQASGFILPASAKGEVVGGEEVEDLKEEDKALLQQWGEKLHIQSTPLPDPAVVFPWITTIETGEEREEGTIPLQRADDPLRQYLRRKHLWGLNEVQDLLDAAGISTQREKGKHWKLKGPDGHVVTIPSEALKDDAFYRQTVQKILRHGDQEKLQEWLERKLQG